MAEHNPRQVGHFRFRGFILAAVIVGMVCFAVVAVGLGLRAKPDQPGQPAPAQEWSPDLGWLEKMVGTDAVREPNKIERVAFVFADKSQTYDSAVSQVGESRQVSNKVEDGKLVNLQYFKRLKWLDLSGTAITDAGLAALAPLSTLEILDLKNTPVTGAGFAGTPGFANLRELDLSQTLIADVSSLNGLVNLEDLTLQGTKASPSSFAKLTNLHKLRRLSMWTTEFTDEGMAGLKGLAGLKMLSVWGEKITDQGLAEIKDLRQLRYLAIWSSAATGTGLAGLPNLEKLEFECPVTDEGLQAISQLPKLKVLRINRTEGITAAGLGHLRAMKTLEELIIKNAQLTDEDLLALEGAGIKELTLYCPRLTEDGVARLIKALPSLEAILLKTSAVTDDGLQRLKEAYPAMKFNVSRDPLKTDSIYAH